MKNAAVAALQIAEAESTNNFSPTKTHEKATKKGKEEVDSFFRIEQDYQQFNSIKLSTIIHLVESYKSCRKGFSSLLRVLLCVASWKNLLWKICNLTSRFLAN